MRILHVVHQYPPQHIGGTELYVQAMAQVMARRGHQIAVFARHSAEQCGHVEHSEGEVQVHLVHNGLFDPARRYVASFGDEKIASVFDDVLHRFQPDIVHVHHLMGLPLNMVNLMRRRGIPFVASLVDYWWVCANAQLLTNYDDTICDGPSAYLNCTRCAIARAGAANRGAAWLASPLLAGSLAVRGEWLRRVLHKARALIAPMPFVADWYLAHGAPQQTLRVVRLGIDYDGTIPQRVHKPGAPVRFLYLGGLSKQKGVHLAVEAFGGVQGSAELWIAGDEQADPVYTQTLRNLANAQVYFLGRLSRAEVWTTLAQVDVVLAPSQWYETYCFVLYEAFAAGAPVITTRLGVLADAVRHGHDGLLVEVGDVEGWRRAMQILVDDPARLDALRAQIRPPVTIEENASHLLDLYAEILEQPEQITKPQRTE